MEGIKKLPSMGFGESVKTVLANLTNFKGRARRSELWWYWVAYAVVAIIAGLALTGFPLILTIISLLLQLSLWAVTVRRLHDRGHSGWWVTAAILIGVFANIYVAGSGYYEIMSSVNPDIEEATKVLSSPTFALAGLASLIVNICIFVFCVRDGKPETNKYGPSPKYIPTDEYIEKVTDEQA